MTAPVLNLQGYVPYFIRATANKLAQAASRSYGDKFGIGLNEWACMALLAGERDIPASRIAEVGGYNKAVISRSIAALEAKGLVASEPVPDHNRKRLLRLTPAGERIYAPLLAMAMEREARLLDGLSEADRAKLLELLRIVHRNAQHIGGGDV